VLKSRISREKNEHATYICRDEQFWFSSSKTNLLLATSADWPRPMLFLGWFERFIAWQSVKDSMATIVSYSDAQNEPVLITKPFLKAAYGFLVDVSPGQDCLSFVIS
jgi:hypothetical protein